MGILKGIGYTLVAILVFCVITVGGAILAALVSFIGAGLLIAGVIGLLALGIREYFEPVSSRTGESQTGSVASSSKESS